MNPVERKKVCYLLGAGASHASVALLKSIHGILMPHLGPEMKLRLRGLVESGYRETESLRVLVTDIVEEDTDYEHLITFLSQSPSALHRKFASDVRNIFEEVLRVRLQAVVEEQGRVPDDLYYGLLDLHLVDGLDEELRGFLTLNYDEFLENAVRRSPVHKLDRGFPTALADDDGEVLVPVLKLHGSFDWRGGLPVSDKRAEEAVWIPPGIQKMKERYPFNLIWGRARELLDCDVLRIVGCNLGENDWDLISLLFTSRLTEGVGPRFEIEVINAPAQAEDLKRRLSYLNVRSILDLEGIGSSLIVEYGGPAGFAFGELDEPDQVSLFNKMAQGSKNWFWIWLKQKAEQLSSDVGPLDTPLGAIEQLLEVY